MSKLDWIYKAVAIAFGVGVVTVVAFVIFFIWACLATMGAGYI